MGSTSDETMHSCAPTIMFHGVSETDEVDELGMAVYQAEPWLLDAMALATR